MVRARLFLLLLSATMAWPQQSFIPNVIGAAPNKMLFASHNGALLQSSDGGATWIPMFVTPAGLPQPPVTSFVVDPNTAALYLVTTTAAGAIWRSLDSGVTWTDVN